MTNNEAPDYFQGRVRNFAFTCYKMELDSHIQNIDVKYIVYGREICPTTKRPHLQGYCELRNGKTRESIKKMFHDPGLHVGKRIGTAIQNRVYCTKDKDYFEKGYISKQGKRTDIEEVRVLVREGGNMRDVIDSARSMQSIRIAERILTYDERKRNWKPEVYWYYGPTGSGKTKTAMEQCEDPWISNNTLKWWQGYDAHEDVIIDDFRRDFCTFHELLRILDRYPYQVEYKGGSRQLLAKRIFITCPFDPYKVYDTREDVQQLIRRITEIKMFGYDIKDAEIQEEISQTFQEE